MNFSLILLVILQIFSGNFCHLSNEFTSENLSIVLNEFENQLLSSNIGCNISLAIQFYREKGLINDQCSNESQNDDLKFQMIRTFNNKEFSYYSSAHHVNSSNRLFINNWINWQNESIQIEKKDFLNFIKFQLWGSFYHNEIDLCFHISINQNESLNNASLENINPIKCLRCRYNYENIINNISAVIIELSDLVTFYSSLNEKKNVIEQASTVFFNLTHSIDGCTTSLVNSSQAIPEEKTMITSDNENLLKLFIFVMSIVVVIVFSIVFIICCIYCNQHRDGYRLTRTS